MKVKPETLDRMAIAMRAVMNHLCTKENLEQLPVGGLFDWWMLAFQHATCKHADKRFDPPVSFVKSLYRDETLPLYPDDTNDETLHTALKKVRDMIRETYDDFVMVCFPNITKELCGVSYYKFNHSKAFIYYNGVEVEVPRKALTSRDPYVLSQIAHTWQTMASPVVENAGAV